MIHLIILYAGHSLAHVVYLNVTTKSNFTQKQHLAEKRKEKTILKKSGQLVILMNIYRGLQVKCRFESSAKYAVGDDCYIGRYLLR